MAYSITKNDYFERVQPEKSEELINRIAVPITVFTQGNVEEIYRSESQVSIAAESTTVITAEYLSSPVSGGVASLEDESPDISILSEEYYCWGAIITVQNEALTAGVFTLVINGTVFNVNIDNIVIAEDTISQGEYGILKYDYPANYLIQSREIGEVIASGLLESFKTPRKDININWRGNPALELGDIFEAPEYQRNAIDVRGNFYIFKNKLEFDGTLKADTDGRKIPEETTTTAGE